MSPPTGTPSRLAAIVEANRPRVEALVASQPLETLIAQAESAPPTRGFRAVLAAPGMALIAELKKASPSAGLLCPDFDPPRLAGQYASGGAHAMSVLTEALHFQGAPGYLAQAREAAPLPALRKDFLVVPHQIAEARLLGADAVLLIAALLTEEELRDLQALARQLGMDALVEVHDRAELDRALAAEARVIGVNNRNLHTFEVTLDTTYALREHVPRELVFVSESGIKTRQHVKDLEAAGVDAILVGESLVVSGDPAAAVARLLTDHA